MSDLPPPNAPSVGVDHVPDVDPETGAPDPDDVFDASDAAWYEAIGDTPLEGPHGLAQYVHDMAALGLDAATGEPYQVANPLLAPNAFPGES